jgi:hypothetical protein
VPGAPSAAGGELAGAASAAGEVRAAAARLREAGAALQRRPRGEIVAALGALLERLRDPASQIRLRLARELPAATGFHPATLAAGLDAGFSRWTAAALEELVERELPASPRRRAVGFPLTGVVLGGAIPMPSVLQILAPLVLGSPVLVRPGSHDPVTARAVAAELGSVDPALGACLEVVPFARADADALRSFTGADCVVATGSDEAVATIAAQVRAWQRFVGYGHRFSFAVLRRSASLPAACGALARDTALWDQLGCLSPLALYAVGWSWAERRELLDHLENEFANLEKSLPSGRIDMETSARRADALGTFDLLAASSDDRELRRDGAGRWALLAERAGGFLGSPLHRVLRVHFVADVRSVEAAIAPFAHQLAAIGVAGVGADDLSALASLRPSRICPLGEMQAPPLSWCHDGQGVLLPLAALTDFEGALADPALAPTDPARGSG